MSEPEIELSVVIPCYNEEENLLPLLLEIQKVLEPPGTDYEVIITDDCSSDGSWQVLQDLASGFPRLTAQRLRERSGQSAALEAGLRASRGATVATLDGDLQNDPGDLPRLLEALERCDCASGCRNASRRQGYGRLRNLSSKIANSFRNALTGEDFSDSACNFRAMKRECFEKIKFFNGAHRFLTTLIRLEGYEVEEIPISSRPRLHGRSKYGMWNRLFRGVRDVLGVRWLKSRHLRYDVAERSRREE